MKLIASAIDFASLERALFARAPAEGAAFLSVEADGGVLRLRSHHAFQPHELDGGAYGHVAIKEDAQVRTLAAIKRTGCAAAEIHTHPGRATTVSFSRYDDEELPAFARYVQNKLRGQPFGALVLGEKGYAGRAWTADRHEELLELELVGEQRSIPAWAVPATNNTGSDAMFDRQVRALGLAGQRRISSLRVAVVGLGGTGSQVVQQLAHLGVRQFTLIDDDRVEQSNLPRLAGARWWDAPIRRSKAAVARRTIRGIARHTRTTVTGTLRRAESLRALGESDIIMGCVDNDGARLILAETAAAYLTPYLDLGVGIEEQAHRFSSAVGGRIAFYIPGGACLACADELDFAEAGEDLESEATRALRVERGYARDRRVEPALMPLNTVIVGLGMIEFLAYFTGVRHVRPFYRYDALSGTTVGINAEVDRNCPICQPAYAKGSRQQIERYALD
jgi:molybdopterin-synthase adenylyltransferase